MQKKPTDKGLQQRVQDALQERIDVLIAGQYDRAEAIEGILKKYDNIIRVKSVADYKSLVELQRSIIGLESKTPTGGKFVIEFVEVKK